MIELYGVFYKL